MSRVVAIAMVMLLGSLEALALPARRCGRVVEGMAVQAQRPEQTPTAAFVERIPLDEQRPASLPELLERAAGVQVRRIQGMRGAFGTWQASTSVSGPWKGGNYLGLVEGTGSRNDFSFHDDNGTPYNLADDERARRGNSDFAGLRSLLKAERPWGRSRIQVHHALQQDSYQDPQGEVGTGVQRHRNTTRGAGLQGALHLRWGIRAMATLTGRARGEHFAPRDLLRPRTQLPTSRRYSGLLGGEEVRNLGGDQVEDLWGYPLPGRSFFLVISEDFVPKRDFVPKGDLVPKRDLVRREAVAFHPKPQE